VRTIKISFGVIAVVLLIGMAAWAGSRAASARSASDFGTARAKLNASTSVPQATSQPGAAEAVCAQRPAPQTPGTQTAAAPTPSTSSSSSATPAPPLSVKEMADDKLCAVKKISVDSFGDDALAKALYGMIINDLAATKKFTITEWPGDADAILRGGAIASTPTESKTSGGQSSGSGGGQAPSGGGGRGETGGQAPSGGGGQGAPGGGGAGGAGAAQKAGGTSVIVSTDNVTDATLAMRIVSKDGTIIWAATKESKGTNGKGPIEDVADAIVAQLMTDLAAIPPARKQ
jgi:hypothetical protein